MRTFGLIGYPLSHSFSKKYFTEKFEKENISDARYELFPVQHLEKDFNKLIETTPELCGLNVTIPHKQEIIPFLNELDETAKAVGAVNCIKVKKGEGQGTKDLRLIGYNTDVYGFEISLKKHLKPHHKHALILGSGGAAKAAAYVLNRMGINTEFVRQNRHYETETLRYKDLTAKHLAENTLIINSTPAGMFPNSDNAPEIPYEALTSHHLLFDMVYNPEETLFMKKGKLQGAAVVNGLEMLHLQAERSWQIWNRN